jgi:hypothetical protein
VTQLSSDSEDSATAETLYVPSDHSSDDGPPDSPSHHPPALPHTSETLPGLCGPVLSQPPAPRVSEATPLPIPPSPPPAHPACQVPPDHFPTGCQSPRTVHTVPEPAPSGPGCYPLPPPLLPRLPHSTYLALCPLPSSYKVLAPSIYKAFLQACERVADDFLASPSELTTLNFLALPKVGLAPGLAKGGKPVDRLHKYPWVSLPEVPVYSNSTPKATTQRMVELGRISTASALLAADNSVVPNSPEVVQALHAKHPQGPSLPFGSAVGPVNGSAPDLAGLQTALDSFKSDTAPGISGWTVPLLRIAFKSDSVQKMVTTLCGMMLSGKAPAQRMWCSSRLVALSKPGGGLGPLLLENCCTDSAQRPS